MYKTQSLSIHYKLATLGGEDDSRYDTMRGSMSFALTVIKDVEYCKLPIIGASQTSNRTEVGQWNTQTVGGKVCIR